MNPTCCKKKLLCLLALLFCLTAAGCGGKDTAETPPEESATGMIMSTLEPMLEMDEAICSDAPPPISIIVITAAMPITIPSIVRSDRATFRRSATRAVERTWTMASRYARSTVMSGSTPARRFSST